MAAGSITDLERSERGAVMLSLGEGKGVGSMRITLIPKAGAHFVSIPLGMGMVGHPSAADLLTQVVL